MRGLDLCGGIVARALLCDSPSQQAFRNPGARRVRKRRAAGQERVQAPSRSAGAADGQDDIKAS
jgi:hypothetical protein